MNKYLKELEFDPSRDLCVYIEAELMKHFEANLNVEYDLRPRRNLHPRIKEKIAARRKEGLVTKVCP